MAVNKLNKAEMGRRIRKEREKMGWTREQFAETVGLSVNAVSNIELGKSGTSLDHLYHICSILGVNFDYVLRGHPAERDSVARITDLLSFLDEKTLSSLEIILRAALDIID